MSYRLIEPVDYPSPEQIRTLMRDARQERSEAIAELFGFGFAALRKVVRIEPRADVSPTLGTAAAKHG